jgi:hypothetical protein
LAAKLSCGKTSSRNAANSSAGSERQLISLVGGILARCQERTIFEPNQRCAADRGKVDGIQWSPGHRLLFGRRLLPNDLLRVDFLVRQLDLLLQLRHGCRQLVGLLLLRGRGDLHQRRGVPLAAIQPLLRHIVEERVKLIELLLRERIVLVVVALRAGDG